MISCHTIKDKKSRICIIEYPLSLDKLKEAMGDDIEFYRTDLERIKQEGRQKDFLALRLALKKVLGGDVKQILYTDDGKPLLSDESYKISFSHCPNCVAVIVNPDQEVGIDVEAPSPKLAAIHTRFLGKKELAFYQESNSFDFLRIAWSAKEALYKIIGEQAYNFAEQLQILPFEMTREGELETLHTDSDKTYKVHYALYENYTLAYCTDEE